MSSKELKNNARSVRMTDRVLAYVEHRPGKSFNQKFEDLVLYAMESEVLREHRIMELEEEIRRLRSILTEIEAAQASVRKISESLDELAYDCRGVLFTESCIK